MGLILDARADANFVDGEFAALDHARLGHFERGKRDELVGPLQVVVLQRRLVHLLREFRLVLGIRLHRIEVLRPLDERAIEDALPTLGGGIGIVPDFAATAQKQQADQEDAHANSIICRWDSSPARKFWSPDYSATGRSLSASPRRRAAKAQSCASPTRTSVSRTGRPTWPRSSARRSCCRAKSPVTKKS